MSYNEKWKISELRDKFDYDKIYYIIHEDNCEVGRAEIEILYDSYEYEFTSVLSKIEFSQEFRDEPIVKISRLEVDVQHREKGIATYLLNESFKNLRLAGYTQWFLNASPLDQNGPSLFQLEKFYAKFGFLRKQLRNQSTLMWFKDEI